MDLTKSKLKGQGFQALMFVLVITSLGVGMLSYAQVDAAPQILANTMSDVPSISEAQNRADHIKHYFLPTAAFYSAIEGAHEEGQYSGETYQRIENEDDIDDHYEETLTKTNDTANDLLEDYNEELTTGFNSTNCNLELPEKYIDMNIESTNISVSNVDKDEDFIRVTCEDRARTTEVQNIQSDSEIEEELNDFRFEDLIVFINNGLRELYDVADLDDDERVQSFDSTSACLAEKSQAEDNAEEDVENTAEDQADSEIEYIIEAAEDAIEDVSEDDDPDGILGRAVDFVKSIIWDTDEFGHKVWNTEDTEIETEITSTDAEKCGCTEDWECSSVDGYDFEADGNQDDGPGDVTCEFDDSEPEPTCPDGYEQDGDECVDEDDEDETTEPECGDNFDYEEGWSCEWSGNNPDPVCGDGDNSDFKWEAEAEAEFEIEQIEIGLEVWDDKYQLPIGQEPDGWQNLTIERRYLENFN